MFKDIVLVIFSICIGSDFLHLEIPLIFLAIVAHECDFKVGEHVLSCALNQIFSEAAFPEEGIVGLSFLCDIFDEDVGVVAIGCGDECVDEGGVVGVVGCLLFGYTFILWDNLEHGFSHL